MWTDFTLGQLGRITQIRWQMSSMPYTMSGCPTHFILSPTICSFFLRVKPAHPSCSKIHFSHTLIHLYWFSIPKQVNEWKCALGIEQIHIYRFHSESIQAERVPPLRKGSCYLKCHLTNKTPMMDSKRRWKSLTMCKHKSSLRLPLEQGEI